MIYHLFKSKTAKYAWKSIAVFMLFTLVQSIMLIYLAFPEQTVVIVGLYAACFIASIRISLTFARIRVAELFTKETALYPIKYFLGGWIILLIVNALALWIIGSENYLTSQPNQESINLLMDNVFYLIFPLTVFVAPIVEELIFREWLPNFFRNIGQAVNKTSRLPEIIGFFTGSFLFTLMHAPTGLQGWITYGGLSLILLGIRLKYTVKASIMMHFYYNTFSILLYLFIGGM